MNMLSEKRNILDFEDPGKIGAELLDVPGFINGLKNHTLRTAPRPNEPLAFAGALAMLAHLSGRAARDRRGTRTNLYLAALAPTGMGKDEPRIVNKLLAQAVGRLASVPDSVSSGEGLEDAMALSPSLLLQTDEADALFSALRGADSRASRLNEMVLRFFSEAKGAHAMRQRAGDGHVRVIPYPHLTLFATGIPKFLYRALSEKTLQNGLLGRCLFLETNDFVPLGQMEPCDLPPDVLAAAKRLSHRELVDYESGTVTPLLVDETPEATSRIRQVFNTCDTVTKRLRDSELDTAAALYVRLPEKILKLAMLHALSASDEHPLMTPEGVDWAAKLVAHLTRRMLYMSQFYVAEGRFDALKKRAIAYMSEAGGQITRSDLLRKLRVDSGTLRKIVLTLHMCDMIEEELLSRNKVVYTLKNVA